MSRADRFISLRWRFILPLFAIILLVAMIAAYTLPHAGIEAATPAAQQLASLMFASLAAFVVIVTFVFVNWTVERVNRVTKVAEALAQGDLSARTGMKATDEVGALGRALDKYADHVQERQDALRLTLRRQRREITHLTTVLESLPEGVVVQDPDGLVVFMNDRAKNLLGTQRPTKEGIDLKNLTALVTDVLGPAIAPGIYALGDPRRVELDGKMISAQAAALLSLSNERVGTVIVLRDITEEVRRERAREALLSRLTQEVEHPIADKARLLANPALTTDAISKFARDMSAHAVALQKLVVEMRELTADMGTRPLSRTQRPLPLETLVWAVANEWRQVAQAENLRLDVQIEKHGLHVLGDERRLRWAIGNLVDNAIKYTPPGGALSLEIKGEEDGMARLRIRDNGVGISPEDLPHVFTRFYRGTPTTTGGRVIRVPGTGQGLNVARHIIESHGGRIHVKSTVGVGTAVYFTLPLTAPMSMELPRLDEVEMEGETVRLDAPTDSAVG
ncbi:MAG TPA: ATP-binding protein [Oceanobacillus sp.]|nr:ATP-binding protein [Oceanobacillus sp.]